MHRVLQHQLNAFSARLPVVAGPSHHNSFRTRLHQPTSALRTMVAQAQQFVFSKGSSWSETETTSEQWLREAPRGAYTTSRTFGGDAVFDLQQHIERLSTSANLMVTEDASVSLLDPVSDTMDVNGTISINKQPILYRAAFADKSTSSCS